MSKKIDRTGEIEYNNYENKMTIIKYKDCDNLTVKFEDGYITNTTYKNFKNRKVKSPYDKTVFGIGYLGEGGNIKQL